MEQESESEGMKKDSEKCKEGLEVNTDNGTICTSLQNNSDSFIVFESICLL